jgi:uncharacterized protein YggT (Ycf19 family)
MATEVIREERWEERPHRRMVGVLERLLDLAFGLLYMLLLIRFALVLFGARQGASFFQLIHDLTQPFYGFFEGLFATTHIAGFAVEWPLLVAIVAYALLHGGIRAVLSLANR